MGRNRDFNRDKFNRYSKRFSQNRQRYSDWRDDNNSFNQNFNEEGSSSKRFHQDNEGFVKFRDSQEQRHPNFGQRRSSVYDRGNGRRDSARGGDNLLNNRQQNQRYKEDSGNENAVMRNMESNAASHTAAPPSPIPANPFQHTTPEQQAETTAKTVQIQNTSEDINPLTHKVKVEKSEQNDVKSTEDPLSPDAHPSPNKSKAPGNTETISTGKPVVNSNKTESKKEESSSSTSSTSTEEETSEEESQTDKKPIKMSVKDSEQKIKSPENNKSSEEDLVFLGKLEKKYVIDDDEASNSPKKAAAKTKVFKNFCILCDKQGHTAFECQMICKNCAGPYHNLKSCPKPANLAIMMQTFMEFCMLQMSQYVPEQRFTVPQPAAPSANTPQRKSKKVQSSKITGKRKRYFATTSEEDEDEEKQDEDAEDTTTTESEEESSSSEPVTTKKRAKRFKTTKSKDLPEYRNTFSPFPTFPTFGAAAAAYNPLIFGQLMQGAFPMAPNTKFKR